MNTDWQSKYLKLKERLSECVMELQGVKAQYEASQHRMQLMKRASDEIMTRKNQLETENTRLNQYVARIEAKLSATAQQTGLANAISKQEALREELAEQKQVSKTLQNEVADLKRELTIVSNALISREAQLLGTENISSISASASEPQRTTELLRNSLLRSVAALKHDNEALQLQLKEEERQRTEAEASLKTVKAQNIGLTKQNNDLLTSSDACKIDLDHAQEAASLLARELEETREKLTKETKRNEIAKSELQRLQGVEDQLAQLTKEYEVTSQRFERSQSELSEAQSKTRELQGQITEYEKLSRALASRTDEAERTLESRTREVSNLKERCEVSAGASEKAQRLDLELRKCQEDLESTKKNLENLIQAHDQLKGDYEIAVSQKNHLQKSLLATLRNKNSANINLVSASVASGLPAASESMTYSSLSASDSIARKSQIGTSADTNSTARQTQQQIQTQQSGVDVASAVLSKLQIIQSRKEDFKVSDVEGDSTPKVHQQHEAPPKEETEKKNVAQQQSVSDILDFSIRGEGNILDIAGSNYSD